MQTFLFAAFNLFLCWVFWEYFGFLYFDFIEARPASLIKRAWSMFLAIVFAQNAQAPDLKQEERIFYAGVAVTTILVPAIIPEMEDKVTSLRHWIFLRTIGAWWLDLVATGILYSLAYLGSRTVGQYWPFVLGGISVILGIGRSSWIRLQPERVAAGAAPGVERLLLIYTVAFFWAGTTVQLTGIGATGWKKEFSELYGPLLKGWFFGWLVGRWPWLLKPRYFSEYVKGLAGK